MKSLKSLATTYAFPMVAILSLLVPAALVFATTGHRSMHEGLWTEVRLFLMNWLYMAVPHLVVIAICAAAESFRKSGGVLALMSLTVFLFAFQAWILWWVPPRESGLAWIFYFPLAGVCVFFAYGCGRLFSRSQVGCLGSNW
jgi:hypothetical protein